MRKKNFECRPTNGSQKLCVNNRKITAFFLTSFNPLPLAPEKIDDFRYFKGFAQGIDVKKKFSYSSIIIGTQLLRPVRKSGFKVYFFHTFFLTAQLSAQASLLFSPVKKESK